MQVEGRGGGEGVVCLFLVWGGGGGGSSMSVTICAKWRNCFVLKMELLLFIGGRVGFIRGF